jgi:hypothetical protein
MSGRLEEANLFDDMSDGAGVQPPYMALLRLATLRGLRDAVLSVGRFAVLVVAGAVLYVFVMGLFAGTLGCCLIVWAGSVAVSLGRILVGAWRGVREGGDGWLCCGGGEADQVGVRRCGRTDGSPPARVGGAPCLAWRVGE